jgi:methionyl-tRNA synthetase
VREVLANCLEVIRIAAQMVAPAVPQAAREILRQIGRSDDEGRWPTGFAGWPGGKLSEPKPIFPRLDADVQKGLITKWMGDVEPTAAPPAAKAEAAAPAEIAIDDFAKIDLRAAKVLTAERVPKTDKLLKLELDLGTEKRTVVSGIAGAYAPEALIGKTVIYLANLKPAKLRGVLSQGMILAAGDKDVLALSAFDRDVPPGTKVR